MTDQKQLFDTQPEPWEIDVQTDALVAKVVFPGAPKGVFDYVIPDKLRETVRPGARLRIPLGRGNQKRLGYCVEVTAADTPVGRLKEVIAVLDAPPLISPDILALSEWIADYYLCDRGVVLETVVPASVRQQAGTRRVTYLDVPGRIAAKLSTLKLPQKQEKALRILAGSGTPLTPSDLAQAAGCTSAPINTLRKKGLINATVRREFHAPFEDVPATSTAPVDLNPDQRLALEAIINALDGGKFESILVHGVTGSGKTEVYIRAVEHSISFGRQAIVLVPEISLTPQTRRRFRARFTSVAVLHSNLTPAARHAEWQRIARGDVQVVVGARSAVFAPLPHLGLIVIDEEHESTFKQETAPRYHARDIAARRAELAGIPLVLGSATPSLESWQAARRGSCRLVQIPNRVLGRPLPAVATIDLRNERHQGATFGILSRQLVHEIRQTLNSKGQVILLLNRRGFATHIQCPACGEVVRCDHCDIALTHHRDSKRAVCHYCNFQIQPPAACPSCQFSGIRFGGYGTQRLEDEVQRRFSKARVQRMDSDTMRAPGSHETALDEFRHGNIDILLGTQMIAKGLDFPNVTLVGVINADTALHLPDFRAAERTFQLVTQVAGRTGRGGRGGRVLVQTFSPDHPAIQAATRHDYQRFADFELPQRQQFSYPPFSHLARLVFRGAAEGPTESTAEAAADFLRKALKGAPGVARLLGPVPAPISKIRGKYRYHCLLQCDNPKVMREALRRALAEIPSPPNVHWIVDIDPVSML
jgi:primosomal protein N' (replication factor Y)